MYSVQFTVYNVHLLLGRPWYMSHSILINIIHMRDIFLNVMINNNLIMY